MKIQYIECDKAIRHQFLKIEETYLNVPRTFDSFDLNIIDFSSSGFWRFRQSAGDYAKSNYYWNDLDSLSSMLIHSNEKTKFLFLLPKNIDIRLDSYGNTQHQVKLKDCIPQIMKPVSFCELANMLIPPSLEFEPNKTIVEDTTYSSDFYFLNLNPWIPLLKAVDSNKVTAIGFKNYYFTTLDINSETNLMTLVSALGIVDESQSLPDWLEETPFFDDEKLKLQLKSNTTNIEKLINKDKEINETLNENRYYKSILISSGDILVKTVFKILEELFSIDLSSFIDLKKEDFNFQSNGITFVGEIKGISSNVKNSNINQVENHIEDYLEANPNVDKGSIRGILIINHQRSAELSERQPINLEQINRAKNSQHVNIIETTTLLTMYERFKAGIITKDDVFSYFSSNYGLTTIK